MSKDKFNIVDHFKGDFKKECPVIKNAEDYFKQFQSPQAFDFIADPSGWDLEIGLNPVNGVLPVLNPGASVILNGLEIECIHEPINVGFVETKMVCKKCDKDL